LTWQLAAAACSLQQLLAAGSLPSLPFTEGPPKKIDGPSVSPVFRVFAKSQTHPPTSRVPPPCVFLVRFRAFLGSRRRQGEFKTPRTYFCKKSTSKTFSKIIDKHFDVSFFLGFFSAMGVQQHYKKHFSKQSRRKAFIKNSTKNPKPFFFLDCFLSRFWAFLVEGSSKTP
jgi:hypothetical protein